MKANPVISEKHLPVNAKPQDFRDPKVFKHGEDFYVVIASCHADESGQILLYKSKELLDWKYVGVMARSENKLGKIWECPDFFNLDSRDVLIISPIALERQEDKYCNTSSCIYMLGDFDFEKCNYNYDTLEEIDAGFDFYAPQTMEDVKGRRILIAWMQMWGRNMPTHEEKHNWAGAMTLPRELKIVEGRLYQMPVEEMKNYRVNRVSYENISVNDSLILEGIEGQQLELELEIDSLQSSKFGLKILKNEENETVMYYDKSEGKFIFDRSKNGVELVGTEKHEDIKYIRKVAAALTNNRLKLRIFIDRCSVEVFIQEGEKTMTSTVYPKKSAKEIEFFSDSEIVIKKLDKWDIRSN